jgi:hypothetical protein
MIRWIFLLLWVLGACSSPLAPQGITIGPSHPNPFTTSTIIPIESDGCRVITLEIRDLRGSTVYQWEHLTIQDGPNEIEWQGKDLHGWYVPTGTYLYGIVGEWHSLSVIH